MTNEFEISSSNKPMETECVLFSEDMNNIILSKYDCMQVPDIGIIECLCA